MKTMINLLPNLYRRQQMTRRRIKQWSALICILLAVGWLFHWRESREQRAMAQKLDVLEREHLPTQTLLKQLVDMRQRLVDLQQQELIANELEHQRNALALLGVISQTAQKTGGRLRVTNLELTNFQSSHKAAGAGNSSGQVGGLLLSGVSLDSPAVFELLDGLQNSGMFSRVVLNQLTERANDEMSLRNYEVRCEF
jgi:type IV pilus assembly PilN-like protein